MFLFRQVFQQSGLFLYQPVQIHLLAVQRRAAGFHAGNIQQLLYEPLHTARNLQSAGQIFVPVLIDVYALQHPGQLSFQDCHRGFQLMGGGGEKGQPFPVQLPFPVNVCPQGGVCLPQTVQSLGEAAGEHVQALRQHADFILPVPAAFAGKVQLRHLLGDGADANDGAGDKSGVQEGAQS